MILESIVSSVNVQGEPNFAPIGVHVPGDGAPLSSLEELELKLYAGTQTYANLQRTREGVINLTDDVLLFVSTLLNAATPATTSSARVRAPRLTAAHSIWEFRVSHFDTSPFPAVVKLKVLTFETFGAFAGFCRGQGAVLEAAIAVTRVPWNGHAEMIQRWRDWEEIVRKTGGQREMQALAMLRAHFFSSGIPASASSTK
jgi:hypothetical protein